MMNRGTQQTPVQHQPKPVRKSKTSRTMVSEGGVVYNDLLVPIQQTTAPRQRRERTRRVKRNFAPRVVRSSRSGRRTRVSFSMIVLVALITAASGFGFFKIQQAFPTSTAAASVAGNPAPQTIERTRICRDQIPHLNLNTLNYRATFDDLNDVQLQAAQRLGIDSIELMHPEQCSKLMTIATCQAYKVDSMRYSKPYLIPEAVMLLHYIGLRFDEILQEHHPGEHYQLVVTSALRSHENVHQLRRRNRNATENSCHCYGTTFDVSYIRFVDRYGNDVNELFLKQYLAQALYELRFEGLCYVKYERHQACFHITVRNTQYRGRLNSQQHTYQVPKPLSQQELIPQESADGTETAQQNQSVKPSAEKNAAALASASKSDKNATTATHPKSAVKQQPQEHQPLIAY